MNKLILLIVITAGTLLNTFAQESKKFFATVFDEDNNPIARGFFKSAADSGIIILVDEMEVFVSATEITTLKVEKNPSKAQFLKLGVASTTEVVSYLINKPSNNHESDSMPAEIETHPFSTETKDALFQRIQSLIRNLLDGINDLATFSINNSSEKFITKLRLLQQYSIDKEIVAWNDYSQYQPPANEINDPQEDSVLQNVPSDDQPMQTDRSAQTETSSSQVKPSKATPVKTTTILLNKGFHIIKSKPVAATSAKNTNQYPSKKNITIALPLKKAEKEQTQTKVEKQITISGNKETPIKEEPKRNTKSKKVSPIKN